MCFLKLKCIICVIYVHPYFFKLYTFVKWFIHLLYTRILLKKIRLQIILNFLYDS